VSFKRDLHSTVIKYPECYRGYEIRVNPIRMVDRLLDENGG